MANAAAKKAAAAKEATAQYYKPFLIFSNLVYFFLLFGRGDPSGFRIWDILGIVTCIALQVYSYFGILDQAANNKNKKKNNKELTGGQHLDWLALSLIVQFLSVLHSTKWYWLLFLFPIVSGYSLYKSFFGTSKGAANTGIEANNPSQPGNASSSRREKRAEKRRMKYS